MTLLEKALKTKRRTEYDITDQHIELALALVRNEVEMAQACRVLKINKHSGAVYSWLFGALKKGVKEKKINIHKTSALY